MSEMTENNTEPRPAGHHEGPDDGPGRGRKFDVTVRTPAGFPHVFTVRANTKVHTLLDDAKAYFVSQGQLQPGNYHLIDVTDGTARPLTDSARLDESGIHEQSILALSPTDPQVDG